MMTIAWLQRINRERMEMWHQDSTRDWSVLEWTGAMCGESGEAANVAKKMLRHELAIPGNAASEHAITEYAELSENLAHELADTIGYAVLVANHIGIDLEKAIADVFNAKSVALGFPQRIYVNDAPSSMKLAP